MGIVKPKFTRRNEIQCRVLEIEYLSKKCAQNVGSNVLKTPKDFLKTLVCNA